MVPLTCPEFDFYAQALVERNGLRNDTILAGQQINAQTKQIVQLFHMLTEDSISMEAKDKATDAYAESLEKTNKLYLKEQRKSKRRGVAALIMTGTTGILGLIILIFMRIG